MPCSQCAQSGHNKATCPNKKTSFIANCKTAIGIKTSPIKRTELLELKKKMSELEKENEELKKKMSGLEKENEELKKKNNKKKYKKDTPLGFLQKLGDDTYNCENDISSWKNSPLVSLDKLKNDCSGKVGELFVEMICNKSNISCVYNGDINSKDGTYDILINGMKVEIKTAKLGKQKGFQHESLRSDGYDYLLFLDITPTYFYMTIIPRYDITKESEILGKTAHLRKGTSNVFKLDLNEKILKTLISKGYTIMVSEEISLEELSTFITTNMKNN